jgi:hypothetical protein
MEDRKNKMQVLITMLIVLFISVTGVTYAYFAVSDSDTTTLRGTAASVNLSLDVNKVFPLDGANSTGVMVPQLSVSENNVSPLSTALKNGCVDGNLNVVCQVYEIIIKNDGGTATQVVDGSVYFYGNAEMNIDVSTVMPNLKWKLISSVDVGTPQNSVLGANADLSANFNKNVFADDVTLKTGDEYKYYMIVWINEINDDQELDEGNSFYGKIDFDSSNGTGVTSTFNT